MKAQFWHVFDKRGQRKYITRDERVRFLAALPSTPGQRYAFCVLIAYSGCRISEALALGPAHVEPGLVRFRTLKRRRLHYRTVPVPEFVTDLLSALPLAGDGERFWQVHRTTAYRWVKRAMAKADVSGLQACPKGLRHGFGIGGAVSGVPQNLMQRWLGHARPDTTAIYMEAVGAEERQIAARMW